MTTPLSNAALRSYCGRVLPSILLAAITLLVLGLVTPAFGAGSRDIAFVCTCLKEDGPDCVVPEGCTFDPQNFDPWATNKWKKWYTGGKLTKAFLIKQSIKFKTRNGAWQPKSHGNFNEPAMFIVSSEAPGIIIDGNNVVIDARGCFPTALPETLCDSGEDCITKTQCASGEACIPEQLENPPDGCFHFTSQILPDVSDLYAAHQENITIQRGFYDFQGAFRFQQPKDEHVEGPTTLTRFELKGFKNGIHTKTIQTHPLVIDDVTLYQNEWAIYLHGDNTTVQNSQVYESRLGGIYLDLEASDNKITQCVFRDNTTEQPLTLIDGDLTPDARPNFERLWWGDIAVDSTVNNEIFDNYFVPSHGPSMYWQRGVIIFRNMGEVVKLEGGGATEEGFIRPNLAVDNYIHGNFFDGYTLAIDVGSRMGFLNAFDLSLEAREHVAYNTIEGNHIQNSRMGIKVNVSGTTVRGNTFYEATTPPDCDTTPQGCDVTHPINVHNVFYHLADVVIDQQPDTDVSVWFGNHFPETNDDFYENMFEWVNGRANQEIINEERYTHVVYTNGEPDFFGVLDGATFVARSEDAPHQLTEDGRGVLAEAGTMRDIAVGDFWSARPGDEVAVIWEDQTSMITNYDDDAEDYYTESYYTIVIYDSNGREIDRSGRSETEYLAIAAGNFLPGKGNDPAEDEEIAVIQAAGADGKFKLLVFRRGRAEPDADYGTVLATPRELYAITAGNFETSDVYDEIAHVYADDKQTIHFRKPGEPWGAGTTVLANYPVSDLAAGELDGNTGNGDEVIVTSPNSSSARAYYRNSNNNSFATYSATNSLRRYAGVAVGNFDGDPTVEQVALASSTPESGRYQIYQYKDPPGPAGPALFETVKQTVLAVPVKALSAGNLVVGAELGPYEHVSSGTDPSSVGSWGDAVVGLPSAAMPSPNPEEVSCVPLFWMNTNAAKDQYRKVMPALR